jgi:hypothetical protein
MLAFLQKCNPYAMKIGLFKFITIYFVEAKHINFLTYYYRNAKKIGRFIVDTKILILI